MIFANAQKTRYSGVHFCKTKKFFFVIFLTTYWETTKSCGEQCNWARWGRGYIISLSMRGDL